ncbi:MAG: bifunctional UDP-N-acetylglucosamine diphosphorylase/glucosamine-1-phosphate N-acetyltransferase GlmU [Bdellovibrionales bacterium]|nr:bifunctional UDP-N-acetylglucosamine diphosphorylase/glucosamine-1-phosphate N-acetyltransferase GlmU [Bdellovibrionales bacterium]
MNKDSFSVIILAAGRGVRMKSSLPKVLHPVAGSPMILRISDQAKAAGASEVRVVVGYGENLVRAVVEPSGATCFKQLEQKGTADAVLAAQPGTLEGPVLILNGDHPLIEAADIKRVFEDFKNGQGGITLVTAELKHPGSYGRIVRSNGELKAIVEAKDASADTLKIREVNTGIYMLDAELLNKLLPQISNANAQKEFYLTDIISLSIDNGIPVSTVTLKPHVAAGVNSQEELAMATKKLFRRKAKALMADGVLMLDPSTTYVEDRVQIGASSVLYPGVYIRGGTKLGSFCVVEPGSFLNNVICEDSVQIKAGCYLEDCVIKTKAVIGPYARLRPETEIGKEARVGNFVEMKKVKFGDGAKAGHLTYLGDAEIGDGTNIGCGTITCNYAADKKKYKTKIGKNVFVGSDTQFVAPISVGDDAVIGSGSTITKDVPAKALAVARGKQFVKENYVPKTPKQEG